MSLVLSVLVAAALVGRAAGARADEGGAYDVSEQEALAGVTTTEEEAGDEGSLWTRETLTGGWGGWRKTLAERGIAFEFTYTGDVFGIVSGGVHRRASYLDDWDLTLTGDLDPLVGWKGGSFFVYGLGNGGTGSPSANAGDIQTLDNIDAPKTWKLYEAWFQQQLLAEKLSVLVGLYNLNGEFDVIDTASLFINSSFGIGKDYSQSGANGPSIFPTTAAALRVKAKPIENTYVQIAALDGVAGDPNHPHGTQFNFDSKNGFLLAGEVGYLVGQQPGSEDDYLKLALGGWTYTANFDQIDGVDADGNPLHRHGNYGMYALGEGAVYREPDAPDQGLSVFGRVGFAESEFNPIGVYLGAGAVYTGLLSGRDADRLGFGVAAAFAGHDLKQAADAAGSPVRDAEVTLELTYQLQIAPWVYLQPDLQYIIHPGLSPTLGNAVAIGSRLKISF